MAEHVGMQVAAHRPDRSVAFRTVLVGANRRSRRPSSGGGRHLRAYSWMRRNLIDKNLQGHFQTETLPQTEMPWDPMKDYALMKGFTEQFMSIFRS